MRCDVAQMHLSRQLDGDGAGDGDSGAGAGAGADVAAHVAGCRRCALFETSALAVRRRLRFEPVGAVPDVAGRVMASLPTRVVQRRRSWVPVAAALLAGMVAGASMVGGVSRDAPVAEAELARRVSSAQEGITSIDARLSVTEQGWHAAVPERRFTGHLTYRSPESLALSLRDTTTYPSRAWVRNDVDLVVTADEWWSRGPRDCPQNALPGCTPRAPRVRRVRAREPFASGAPAPLELVVPVRSFSNAAASPGLGTRRVAGRGATGVVVSAGQVAPLLDGLRPAGNLRSVHPSDAVRLWLDSRTLIPLQIEVVAGDGPDRRRWAADRGYVDQAGSVVLDVRLSAVRVNRPVGEDAFAAGPDDALSTSGGFEADPVPVASPAGLPRGYRAWRSGRTTTTGPSPVDVASWTDGRAWVKVRSTTGWAGPGLFGDIGGVARPIDLGRAGVGYMSEDGTAVAVHGTDRDLVVLGSARPAVLLAVASSMGTRGTAVPSAWPEASSASLAAVVARGLRPLVLPARRGFGPPSLRVDDVTVTVAYAGPGERGFVLVTAPGRRLSPPLDPGARGAQVRGRLGRYSPSRGELEWVEGGRVLSLRSKTLSAGELVGLARDLRQP